MNRFWLTVRALLALLVLGYTGVRASLPPSACDVEEARFDTLILEKMRYGEVKAHLGCEGVRIAYQKYSDELIVETFAWRGAAWPYAVVKGEFINGVLHGTEKRTITLSLSLTPE